MAVSLTVALSAAPPQKRRAPARSAATAGRLACGNVLAFQILMDRRSFSPGQIDGKSGANLTHAVAALQSAKKLKPSGQLDCATWRALGGDRAGDLLAPYTITADDVNASYEPIPREIGEQAKLAALNYSSLLERLGERFHTAPALIEQLNGGTPLTPGTTIKVPAVKPFEPASRPPADPEAGRGITVVVSKHDSAVRAVKSDGTTVFFAPVTTGSEHDPLPTGDWKVTGVQWNPPFHFNPALFWDATADESKATIKPGPNNPVGVVWIDLDLEHYGLHGTPEPGNVGHTESHGCVRLTNWDAARLASLVKPGTPVQFR